MKKINWGHKLTFVITGFCLLFVGAVFFMTTHEVNLVSEDYYPRGMNYQEKIDKKKNAATLSEKVTLKATANQVEIQFPRTETIQEGTIHFYRPSDFHKDWTVAVNVSENNLQSVSTDSLENGLYWVKIDWVGTKPYYVEQRLIIEK